MSNETRKPRAIIVVDPDEAFLESLRAHPRAQLTPVMTASKSRDGLLLISDKSRPIMALFLNPILPNIFDPGLIRHAHHYRSATPIHLLYDRQAPLSAEQLEGLGVQSTVKKPTTYDQLLELADPRKFDAAAALALAGDVELDAEVSGSDSEFKPIRAGDFISGSKSFFDIYVRLTSGRYVLILKAGDSFDPERVASYLVKGVTSFYIRKEAQESFLNYCDHIAAAITKSEKVSTDVKVSQVLNFGQETVEFLRDHGIRESSLEHASRFVKHLHGVLKTVGASKDPALKKFMADIALLEHGNAAAVFASLMMKPMNFTDPNVIEQIGFACMFHDIGLQEMPEKFRAENEIELSPAELELYYQHPAKGAEKIKSVHGIGPAISQAILQHHERRNRKGFPTKLGPGAINGVAQIVGICDEFTRVVIRAKEQVGLNPISHMERVVFDGFSTDVVEAFRKSILTKTD